MIEESEDPDASRMQAKMSFVPIDQLASYINNKVRQRGSPPPPTPFPPRRHVRVGLRPYRALGLKWLYALKCRSPNPRPRRRQAPAGGRAGAGGRRPSSARVASDCAAAGVGPEPLAHWAWRWGLGLYGFQV